MYQLVPSVRYDMRSNETAELVLFPIIGRHERHSERSNLILSSLLTVNLYIHDTSRPVHRHRTYFLALLALYYSLLDGTTSQYTCPSTTLCHEAIFAIFFPQLYISRISFLFRFFKKFPFIYQSYTTHKLDELLLDRLCAAGSLWTFMALGGIEHGLRNEIGGFNHLAT